MHDVILSLQEKICKLEEEKELMEKHGGFEIVATQVASANVELVAQNRQLVEAIEEHQAYTVKVGYGPSIVLLMTMSKLAFTLDYQHMPFLSFSLRY